ncbi:InlB B-repeat-containing protein [endosymbiont 'TC1' of Trimyema compressum]
MVGGDKATVVTNPTRTGYVFQGWNTAQDGSGDT